MLRTLKKTCNRCVTMHRDDHLDQILRKKVP